VGRLCGVDECIGQAGSFNGLLGDAAVNIRSLEIQNLQNGWDYPQNPKTPKPLFAYIYYAITMNH